MIRRTLILITITPIILIFSIGLLSQYLSLTYARQQIQNFQNSLFQVQIMFSKQISQITTQQLDLKMQIYAILIYTMNSLFSKIQSGIVLSNPLHQNLILNSELLFRNQENPALMDTFNQNFALASGWYQQNTTSINDLSIQAQNLLKNASLMDFLMHSFNYEYYYTNYNSSVTLQRVLFIFQNDPLIFATARNLSFANGGQISGCNKTGLFNFDPRCATWYQAPQKYLSLSMNQPSYVSSVNDQFTNLMCQKMMQYDPILQKDTLHHVECFNLQIKNLGLFFQNFANSTIQSYIVDPRSQMVLYDSRIPNGYNNSVNLNDIEFKYLNSKSESVLFNNTLNNYNLWVQETIQNSNLEEFSNFTSQQIVFPYQRNNTSSIVILSPIYIIDRLPQFKNVKGFQPKGYQVEIAFVQINIISDTVLQEQSNELMTFFNKYFLFSFLFQIGLGICLIIISIYYSHRIRLLVNDPVIHLTDILKRIEENSKTHELYQVFTHFSLNSEEIFLAQETRDLYDSFESVIQMLLYTSENFFVNNETLTLLRLNRNIEFFKQFQNTSAVGITHNNIGSILLNQGHYFQALEHFSSAIVYAKYEIQDFFQANEDSISGQILKVFGFETYEQKSILENMNKNVSIFDYNNPNTSFNSHFQHLKTKTNSQNTKPQKSSTEQLYEENNKFKTNTLDRGETNQPENTPIIINKQQNSNNNEEMITYKNILNHIQTENIYTNIKRQYEISKSRVAYDSESFSRFTCTPKQNALDQKIPKINSARVADQFYEQRIQLLSNLYYRKKNYISTLIAFQEYHEGNELEQSRIYSPYFNFWKEIKDLLKKLIVLLSHLPSQQSQEIEILTLISKCHLNLNKFMKSEIILNYCENVISKLDPEQTNQTVMCNKFDQIRRRYKSFLKTRENKQNPEISKNEIIKSQVVLPIIRPKQTTTYSYSQNRTSIHCQNQSFVFNQSRNTQSTMTPSQHFEFLQFNRQSTSAKDQFSLVQKQNTDQNINQTNKSLQQTYNQITTDNIISLPSNATQTNHNHSGIILTHLDNPRNNRNSSPSFNTQKTDKKRDLLPSVSKVCSDKKEGDTFFSNQYEQKLITSEKKSSNQLQDSNRKEILSHHLLSQQQLVQQFSPAQSKGTEQIPLIRRRQGTNSPNLTFQTRMQSQFSFPQIGLNSQQQAQASPDQNTPPDTSQYTLQRFSVPFNHFNQFSSSLVQQQCSQQLNNQLYKKVSMENNQQQPYQNVKSIAQNLKHLKRQLNRMVEKSLTINSNNKQQLNDDSNLSTDKKDKNNISSVVGEKIDSKNLEIYLDNMRKIEEIIEDQDQLCNEFEVDSLSCIIDITKAEFLLKQHYYYDAANILTSLMETNKKFMSHFPYQIIQQIKQIFDFFGIFSSDLNNIFKKFNPNISLQVAMVFACQNQSDCTFKSISLFSNMMTQALTQQGDHVGIILSSHQDFLIQLYLGLQPVNQIKPLVNQIIQDIHHFVSEKGIEKLLQEVQAIDQIVDDTTAYNQSCYDEGKSVDSKQNSPSVQPFYPSNTNTDQFNNLHNQTRDSMCQQPIYMQNMYQFGGKDSPQMYENRENSFVLEDTIDRINPLIQSPAHTLVHNSFTLSKQRKTIDSQYSISRKRIRSQQEQLITLDENLLNEKSSELSSVREKNNNTFIFLEQKMNSNQFHKNKDSYSKDTPNQQYKPQKLQGDDQSERSLSDSSGSDEDADSSRNVIFKDRNFLFHQCIRKAVLSLFLEQNYQYLLNPHVHKIKDSQYAINKITRIKKIIIFSTDRIEVIKNDLFDKLCLLLSSLHIKVILFSSTKGTNFLEMLPELTYRYQDQVIIKVFYSHKRIIKYLQNQRNSIFKNTYPTYVQHF